MHANSFHLQPIELKYSRNTPLNKILLRQSEESDTGEEMLQISATMMGSARRLKNRDGEQQEHWFELVCHDFLGERKSWGGRDK
jgi:hypothetical protein